VTTKIPKTIQLYQLPISHFCEKVRWALDYKGLLFERRNLLPGLHAKTASRLTGQTALPILHDQTRIINDSAQIIDYLDQQYPHQPLTPIDHKLEAQARAWERFADQEIGVHVRRCCYYYLLDYPEIFIELLSQQTAWYGKFVLRCMFGQLRDRMRALMNISKQGFLESKARLELAVEKVAAQVLLGSHLAGPQFSRADLAVAALFAPLCRPSGYGVNWPKMPAELEQFAEPYHEILEWVNQTYHHYRSPVTK